MEEEWIEAIDGKNLRSCEDRAKLIELINEDRAELRKTSRIIREKGVILVFFEKKLPVNQSTRKEGKQ